MSNLGTGGGTITLGQHLGCYRRLTSKGYPTLGTCTTLQYHFYYATCPYRCIHESLLVLYQLGNYYGRYTRMATVEEVRGEPSRLIRRRRSLWVSDLACRGAEARGLVARFGADCGVFAVGGGTSFFAFLHATCNQSGRAGGWIGLGAWVCDAAGRVAASGAAGLGVGV